MGKRSKSKSNKLARMSEEERARYMQHRLEFELEAKRRRQQLIATFTKNKLKREEAFAKLNIAKINEKWRFVLRQIKCKELYEDVKYLCTTFDRAMKIKDSTISCLYNELEKADADHRRLQESHIILIDKIIGKYKKTLVELHETYKINNIKLNATIELKRLKDYGKHCNKELTDNLERKYALFEQTQTIRKTQNAVNIFTILYLEEDIASDLEQQSFLNIDKFWDRLCNVINEYQRVIDKKRKQYEYLKEQDDIYQASISQYPKIHSQLQNVIESLKLNTETLSQKRNERMAVLQMKDKELTEKLKNIKSQFTVTQMVDIAQLKKLTVTSNKTLKHLQTVAEKGSTILELFKICSSLEPLSFNLKKYFIQDSVYTELTDTHIPDSCSKVSNFWVHYNHMKANNILLRKESKKLCVENRKLQRKLQAYLKMESGILALHPVPSPSV